MAMIHWYHALKPYERHLSAAALAGGFGFDYASYGRLDHPVTQTLLLVYMTVAAGSIALLDFLQTRADSDGIGEKLRGWLPRCDAICLRQPVERIPCLLREERRVRGIVAIFLDPWRNLCRQ